MGVGEPLFELRDIHFAYGDGREVLSGAEFVLQSGERVALVGGNGSGKSTLLRLLVGLIKPTRGTLIAFGQERRSEADFHEVRCRAGMVFQHSDDQLFCPTVLDDVAFGPLNLGQGGEEALASAADALARVGLAGFEERITYRLSAGEKRLVAIATVLAMQPEALLLDEPAAGLDDDARARLIDALANLPQALLLVSHDATLRNALTTRTVTLVDGRLG